MDTTTEKLVDFACNAEYAALSAETVHECKRRLIDTFACAIGAFDEPVCKQARTVASRYQGTAMATVWGTTSQSSAETAAFANGVMLRFMDISDTYLGKSRGHPSDVIAGILAVAEAERADGASVINAITLAYDVYCSFCDAIDINSKGWDQPVYGVLSGVLGAGKLMRLSREQMTHAIALALAPNMALMQSRRGDLSSWKGCAGANAARNSLFAAMLARDGFTGPTAVFEGAGGLYDAIGHFEWPLPTEPHLVTQSHIKSLPVCYHGQSAVLAALEMRPRVKLADIEEIHVESYRTAVSMMGADPSRWAPETRETADHSLPYVIAIALLDGEVTNESFPVARFADPKVTDLMRKVKVSESAELSAQYPDASPSRLSIRTRSGELQTVNVKYPTGHAKNPMDDATVERKFFDMFRRHGTQKQTQAALTALWSFEKATDVTQVIRLMAAD